MKWHLMPGEIYILEIGTRRLNTSFSCGLSLETGQRSVEGFAEQKSARISSGTSSSI